jgi:hypothetical protein
MGHFRHLRFVSYSVFALCWILRFRPRIKALRLPNAANLLVSAEEQHKLLNCLFWAPQNQGRRISVPVQETQKKHDASQTVCFGQL